MNLDAVWHVNGFLLHEAGDPQFSIAANFL
jgi:hypothetical protein